MVSPHASPRPGARPLARRWRWAAAVFAALVALVVGAWLGVPALVRARVARAALERGLDVSVSRVGVRFDGVSLSGVQVRLEGVPEVLVEVSEVRVEGWWGARRAATQGGRATVRGEPTDVWASLAAWRSRHAGGGSSHGSASSVEWTWGEWDVSWSTGNGLSAQAKRLRWERQDESMSVSAAEARVSLGDDLVVVGEASARLARTAPSSAWLPVDVHAARVSGAVTPSAWRQLWLLRMEASEGTGASEPSSPSARGPSDESGSTSAWGAEVADRVRGWVARVLERAPSASAQVGELELLVRAAGGEVRFGPGRFEAQRDAGGFRVALTALASVPSSSRGLLATLDVPSGWGKPSPTGATEPAITLSLDGGPVPLSSLGLQEGKFGLESLARSQLVLQATVRVWPTRASFEGSASAASVTIRHAALADAPVEGLALSVAGALELDAMAGRLTLREASLGMGGLRVKLDGTADRLPGARAETKVALRYEVPLIACQELLDSFPSALVPLAAGMKLAGSFALRGELAFDTTRLDKTFRMPWDLSSSCRFVSVPPAVDVARFRAPFARSVVGPRGEPISLETGPTTASWTPIGAISPFLEAAVLSTEDAAFHRHAGFDAEAIRNSVRENLRARKFVRGASTISMQLAKNLYLGRGKTVSRKLQEAFLTAYLEQELTKRQLLELYFNVVELGPAVYGVRAGAEHQFHTSPSRLSVSQAFYLMSILPKPSAVHAGAGGAVTPGYVSHLRRLMKNAHRRKLLADDELDLGLRETPVVGSPATELAEPSADTVAPSDSPLEEPPP